jgi:hypothetical protein
MLAWRVGLIDAYTDIIGAAGQHHQNIEVVFDRILNAAAGWNPEEAKSMRGRKRALESLNADIAKQADKLVRLLKQRENIYGHSFGSDHSIILEDLIIQSVENDPKSCLLQDELKKLPHHTGFHFPSIARVIEQMGAEAQNAQVYPCDVLTEQATKTERPSLRDFVRALISNLYRDNSYSTGQQPNSFKLKDDTIASLTNCLLDFDPDDLIDAQYVKSLRQTERNIGGKIGPW